MLKELSLMYIMLWKEDSELEHAMRSVQLGALFALSWPLTWFSHALHHYEQVRRFSERIKSWLITVTVGRVNGCNPF